MRIQELGCRLSKVTAEAVAVAALALGGQCALAASAPAKPANVPPNLNGVWMNNAAASEQRDADGNPLIIRGEPVQRERPAPPLTPEYMAIYRKVRDQMDGKGRDPSIADLEVAGTTECKWPGMPTIMGWPFPFEIVQLPDRMLFLFEADSQVRRVFMDGREHPSLDELDPTYNGHSIGRWENGTLVIDTVGIKTKVLMNDLPHSEEVKLVERMRLTDSGTLENEITMTDPQALTAPVVRKLIYGRRDWEIKEYSCADNNRNELDESGVSTSGVSPSGR
jgi:hypothetical protein